MICLESTHVYDVENSKNSLPDPMVTMYIKFLRDALIRL